ncbi:rod shape-determining protein MreD [Psychrobacter sp. 2Y5]|uniref:rod shape-determining protein MreD n=1 Tax=unclassified Psychrobacter TaxID=196806 RepID=UPI003F44D5DC
MAYPDSEHPTGLLISAMVLSFIVASSLSVYPLSQYLATLRPLFMVMVLIFWLLFQPRYAGVFLAFAVGLIADLLTDSLLGQQAFAAVVVAFTIKISSIYLKQLNTLSAWIIAGLSLFIFQLTLWLLQIITQSTFVAQSAFSLVLSIISWPLVLLALRKFTR